MYNNEEMEVAMGQLQEQDRNEAYMKNQQAAAMMQNQQQLDGLNTNNDTLLPCSIRCPGMTGEIPTLQCKRCLCLYHPECLGLPPNLNFSNFFCAVSIYFYFYYFYASIVS